MVQNPVTGREGSRITEHSTGIRPGGAARKEQAVFDYVFSRDAGAVGTFLMRGPTLPINAIITDAYIDVVTVPTSGGAASIGLGFATTTDINAEDVISGVPWNATGPQDVDNGPEPGTETGYIKLTAAAGLQITIGVAALTAGHFYVVVEYDVTAG